MPKEQDRKHYQEQAVDDASDSDAGPVKEVADNAGALARKHEEPQSAGLPVTKRICTMAKDACAKDHRRDLQLPPQGFCKLEVGMLPLHWDAKLLRDQAAQLTDKEQNTLAEERGAKRCRILGKLPSGEGVRRTRDQQRGAASKEEAHTLAALEVRPLPKGHAYSTADLAAMKAKGHGSQAATGPTERAERDVEEEQERQAHLRCVQHQLNKCYEDADYTRASAVLEITAPPMFFQVSLATHSWSLECR